jgi:hypothetical protein
VSSGVADARGANYFGNLHEWTLGEWHLFQFEFRESSVGGNDGVFRWWVDGRLFVDDHDIKTREDYANLKRPYVLGFYDSWWDPTTDRNDFYIDDAYHDTSWARVEIGNAPAYNACTHREIQIPSAWSDGSVTFKVNKGSFAQIEPEQAFLFVVNPDGVNSAGYPVVIE